MNPEEIKDDGLGTPVQPDGWTVAQLGTHGLILTCDGLQIRLSRANAEKFFDIIEADGLDSVQTDDGFWIEVDADAEDGDVIVRPLHKSEKAVNNYPDGVVIDTDTLAEIGVVLDEKPAPEPAPIPEEPPAEEEEPPEDGEEIPATEEPDPEPTVDEEDDPDSLEEGVKMAFRRKGNKVARGFRVTSGIRKGRVVANIKTAHKPRAPAATRAKLRLARKRKKVVRVLKSKRTRKKALSKRIKKLNSTTK